MSENNQNLINALANAFLLAKNTYLPPETVPKFNKETADFFLEKAQKDKDNESLLKFCINTALNFTKGSTHLELVSSWITTGQVKVNDEVLPMTLDPKQKYEILKSYWASSQFTLDQKKELRDKALESDDSDAAVQVKKVLDWILPDSDLKKRLWEDITESQSKESLMDLRLKMQGFMAGREQKDLIQPYSEKYYAILKKVVDTRDREFAEAFMNNLSPAFMAREQDESAFRELLNRTTDDTHFFTIFLKKQVELIEIIKKSRQLCETFKID